MPLGYEMKRVFANKLFRVMIVFLCLTAVPCWGQSNESIIDHLRQVNVSSIDPKLASMPYEAWLIKTLGANATINWELDDCGEGGDREGPLPMCVTAIVKFKEYGEATISIAVGSSEKGVFGKPEIFNIYIEGAGPSMSFGKLHQLPDYLREIEESKYSTLPFSDKPLVEQSAINFAKNIDIRTFIPAQSKQTLLSWIEVVAGAADKVTWKLDGCDQVAISMQLSGKRDYRACVVSHFENKNESVLLLIYVGTYRKGLVAVPKITLVQVYDKRNIRITTPAIKELQDKLAVIRRIDHPNSGKMQ